MAEKAVEQLLSLNPERLQLASENTAVRKWNLGILDDLVQTAVSHFPKHPSKEELENYRTLNKRLRQLSKQFVGRDDKEFTALDEHIKELADKVYKEDDPRIRHLFSNHITKKILKFGGVIDSETAGQYRLKLINYVESKLIVAIPQLRRKEDREKVRTILEKLVAIQNAMERFDIDGALEDVLRSAIKHFVFNGVMSHRIYQNLLNYEAGSFPIENPSRCFEAINNIHQFVFLQLVPFLRDPDVQPRREDIERIVAHLNLLGSEFIIVFRNLLRPSIQTLQSFL